MYKGRKIAAMFIIAVFICSGVFGNLIPGLLQSAAAASETQPVKVEAYNANTTLKNNTIFPWFKITNTGNTEILLENINARYYYTNDQHKPQKYWCDWCSKCDSKMVSGTFGTLTTPRQGADTYFELGFKSGAGKLKPGNSVEVHIRVASEDWSNYNQANDYSFNSTAKTYVSQEKVAGFVSGRQVWGNNLVSVTEVSLDYQSVTLKVGGSDKLYCEVLPTDAANKNLTWESSNPGIVSVDANGTIKGISQGTATVTVTSVDGGFKDQCIIQVNDDNGPKGTLEGKITDAVNKVTVPRAKLSLQKLTSASEGYVEVASSSSGEDGIYSIQLPFGEYKAIVTKDGYISAINFVNIQQVTTTYNPELKIVGDEYAGAGTASGVVRNAINNLGIKGLNIQFRQGINAREGTAVATAVTGEGGAYSVQLNGGNYTAEISGIGYSKAYFDLVSIGGRITGNQDGVVTPKIEEGQTRIVLTWDKEPLDIDSHLTGPTPDGSKFHTYYDDRGYDYSGTNYADLDLDDRDGYGPETTTVYKESNGTYTFYVHDFTNYSSTSSTKLANSGAQVKVFRGAYLVETYNVPVKKEGTLWTVFSMTNGVITPINTMSYESNTENIGGPESNKHNNLELEDICPITIQAGEIVPLKGTIVARTKLEKVTICVKDTVGYYDSYDARWANSGTMFFLEDRFKIDTNAEKCPLGTGPNPFYKPGKYTIVVWAKGEGSDAKILGEIPVTVTAAASKQITVKGVLAPMLKNTNSDSENPVATPLGGFTVKIMDRSDTQEKLLATVVTDSSGYFEKTIPNDLGPNEYGGLDIFLRLNLEDETVKVARGNYNPQDKDDRIGETVYTWDSEIKEQYDKPVLDFGEIHPSGKNGRDLEIAFSIWRWITKGRSFYRENTTDHYVLPKINAYYGVEEDGNCFFVNSEGYPEVHYSYGGAEDVSTVLHEYGHFIMNIQKAEPGEYNDKYSFSEPCDPQTAYCEAWAEFFPCAVNGDLLDKMYTFADGGYIYYNMETLEYTESGETKKLERYDGNQSEYDKNGKVILFICSMFWDLIDSNNDTGHDTVSIPFSGLDAIMRAKNNNVYDFYRNLFKLGYAKGQEESVWRVMDDIGVAHDVTLPTINLEWDLLFVSDQYMFKTLVTDDIAVKGVEWSIDGVDKGAFYDGTLDSIQADELTIKKGDLTDGIHKLKVIVYDLEGYLYETMHRPKAYSEKTVTLEVKDGAIVDVK